MICFGSCIFSFSPTGRHDLGHDLSSPRRHAKWPQFVAFWDQDVQMQTIGDLSWPGWSWSRKKKVGKTHKKGVWREEQLVQVNEINKHVSYVYIYIYIKTQSHSPSLPPTNQDSQETVPSPKKERKIHFSHVTTVRLESGVHFTRRCLENSLGAVSVEESSTWLKWNPIIKSGGVGVR